MLNKWDQHAKNKYYIGPGILFKYGMKYQISLLSHRQQKGLESDAWLEYVQQMGSARKKQISYYMPKQYCREMLWLKPKTKWNDEIAFFKEMIGIQTNNIYYIIMHPINPIWIVWGLVVGLVNACIFQNWLIEGSKGQPLLWLGVHAWMVITKSFW